jgi:hypothetical protein
MIMRWPEFPKYPSLQALSMQVDWEDLIGVPDTTTFVVMSMLSYVNLRNFALDIIRSPRRARVQHVGFDRLMPALLLARHSLKSIEIQIGCSFDPRYLSRIRPFASLHPFECLHSLTLPHQALIPRHYGTHSHTVDVRGVLPPSITMLEIMIPRASTLLWLESLERHLPYFSRLSTLVLRCYDDCGKPASWFREAHPVLEKLTNAGVTIEFWQYTLPGTENQAPDLPNMWIGRWGD